jgi:hypothetical protein
VKNVVDQSGPAGASPARRLAGKALASWSEEDLVELARLLRRFADNLMQAPGKP